MYFAMGGAADMRDDLLVTLREGGQLTLRQQVKLTLQLSIPAVLAQISTIVMQYIDASMVGRLGAEDSASIGLVSTSTWFLFGLCRALVVGFSVLVAQSIGAEDEKDARNLVKQALITGLLLGIFLAAVGSAIAGPLPRWLRAEEALWDHASDYFLIYSLSMPIVVLSRLATGLLQASGDMRTPSVLMVVMCVLDVFFNQLLIFPTREIGGFTMPGAGLGVTGAALGTAFSELVIMLILVYILLFRSPVLRIRKGEHFHFVPFQLKNAVRLGVPVAVERMVMTSAQIMATSLIAPLGAVSIAANSFAVTAEGFCYMPGNGVQSAAVTLIGQSVGARRRDLIDRLAWVTVVLGMIIMGATAVLMYLLAPSIIGLMTPDPDVVALGTQVLRLEIIAEPFFGAAIVCAGVFQGAGSSLISSILDLASMWGVRMTLTVPMVAHYGLRGAWIAMTIELFFRGAIFLFFLWRRYWLPKDLRPVRSKK